MVSGEFSSKLIENESAGSVDVTDEKRIEIQLTSGEINIEDEDKTKNIRSGIPVADPPPSKNLLLEKNATDTYMNVGTTEKEERGGGFNLTKERELKETDLNLETVYEKQKTYEFCLKCRFCIDKIFIRCRDHDELRCPSCFEFLKPPGTFAF